MCTFPCTQDARVQPASGIPCALLMRADVAASLGHFVSRECGRVVSADAPYTAVVLANAGTHNHRLKLLTTPPVTLPERFRGMGPGVRRDDSIGVLELLA